MEPANPNEMINEQIPPQAPQPSNTLSRILQVGVVIVLLLLVGATIFLLNREQPLVRDPDPSILPEETLGKPPSPTPMPLSELTIPGMRERSYTSNLDELQQVFSNASYTSYLTSYDSDGLKINALLTQPSGDAPSGGWPAVVFVHGYIPPAQYDTLTRYQDYVDYIARNGFVVLKIDLRGHGTSEGESRGAYYSPDYVVDILNARAALQGADFVDAQAIGLWGHSMAGNAVLRASAVKPEIPATVIWAGAILTYGDRLKYGINDNSYVPRPTPTGPVVTSIRTKMRELYGEYDATVPFWQAMSPATYLSDLQGAIQINHAINDDVVNIGYSRDFAELIENTDVPFELNQYQSGGHNITGATFVEAMENTTRFFHEYLK